MNPLLYQKDNVQQEEKNKQHFLLADKKPYALILDTQESTQNHIKHGYDQIKEGENKFYSEGIANQIQETNQLQIYGKNDSQNQQEKLNNELKNLSGGVKEQNLFPVYQLYDNSEYNKDISNENSQIKSQNQSSLKSQLQSKIINDSDINIFFETKCEKNYLVFFQLNTNQSMDNIKLEVKCDDYVLKEDNICIRQKLNQLFSYYKFCIEDFQSKNHHKIEILMEKRNQIYQLVFIMSLCSQSLKTTSKKLLNNKEILCSQINYEQKLDFLEQMYCSFSLYDFINYFQNNQFLLQLLQQPNLGTALKQYLTSNSNLIMNYLLLVSSIQTKINDLEINSLLQKLAEFLERQQKNNFWMLVQQQVYSKQITQMKKVINLWLKKISNYNLIFRFLQFWPILNFQIDCDMVNLLMENQNFSLVKQYEDLEKRKINLDNKTWFELIKRQVSGINNLSELSKYVLDNQLIILKLIKDYKMFMVNTQQSLNVLIRQKVQQLVDESRSVSSFKSINEIDQIIQTRFLEDQIDLLNSILINFNYDSLSEKDQNDISEIIKYFQKYIKIQTLDIIQSQLKGFEDNQQVIEQILQLMYQKILNETSSKEYQKKFLETIKNVYERQIEMEKGNDTKFDMASKFIKVIIKYKKFDNQLLSDNSKEIFKCAYQKLDQTSFIQSFYKLNNILNENEMQYPQYTNIFTSYKSKLIKFLNQKVIKGCKSQKSFQEMLTQITERSRLKNEFSSNDIFNMIVLQLQQIKNFDHETIFEDDFYSLFVFLLKNEPLFQKHELYTRCEGLAKKFEKIEDIEWGIIQNYLQKGPSYERFLNIFNVEIKFTEDQMKILQNASKKVFKVEKFLNILTQNFSVQKSDNVVQKCLNLNKTYNKAKWSQISKNRDLQELDNYQDIIQISDQLVNSIIFKSTVNQFSSKNTINEVYQTIKQQILPILFYVARQVSIGTGLSDFSQKIPDQKILTNQYISQQIISDQPFLLSYIYILEKYLVNVNQQDEIQEMEILNEILVFMFQDQTKFKEFIDQKQVGKFMGNSRQIQKQIQKAHQIISISKKIQVEFPNNLEETFNKLNLLKQNQSTTYLETLDFYNSNRQNFSKLYENTEDIHFKLIPILKNYSNILNKWSDQNLNELKLSDEQDIAEQINWLINIKKNLINYGVYDQIKLLDKEKNLLKLLEIVTKILSSIQEDQSLVKQIESIGISFQRIQDYFDELQGGQSSINIMNQFLKLGTIFINFQDISNKQQEEIIFQIEESKAQNEQPQKVLTVNNQQNKQGHTQIQNNLNQNAISLKKFDMDEIYSIQSRLNLQAQNIQDNQDQKYSDIKQNKEYFDDLVKQSQKIAQTFIYLDEQGSLESQIQKITIQIKNKSPNLIIQELKEVINVTQNKTNEWKSTLLNLSEKYPVLQLIPLHLLRKFSYYIFKKFMQQIFVNEKIQIEKDYSYKIKPSIDVLQKQFDFESIIIESNCENFLKMIFIDPSYFDFKKFENELTIFRDPNTNASSKIAVIAEILQNTFLKNNKIKLAKEQKELLQICKKKVIDNQDCIKFLLRFPSITPYQVLICNQDTTFQDISCFFLRATKFEFTSKQNHLDKYFLVNFDKLNYISQQKTIKLINQINSDFIKSQNKIFVIYCDERDKQQIQNFLNYQQISDAWQDFLQINDDKETLYDDKVSVSKANVFVYTSKRAGEGKSYQIKKKILNEAQIQQYVRVPLHQFENLDSFVSNILKNINANSKLNTYYHLDVCYDETDEVSLLLYQILMLNCINKNFKTVYLLPYNSIYYVEKSNFFERQYIQFLDLINNKANNKINPFKENVEFSLKKFIIDDNLFSQHQFVFQYLKLSRQSENSFYSIDFINQDKYLNLPIINSKEAQDLLIKLFQSQGIKENDITFSHIDMFIQQLGCKLEQFQQIEIFKLDYIQKMQQQQLQGQNQQIFSKVRNNLIQTLIQQSLNSTLLIEQQKEVKKVQPTKKETIFQKELFKCKKINLIQETFQQKINQQKQSLKKQCSGCHNYFKQLFNQTEKKRIQQTVQKNIQDLEKQKDEEIQKFQFLLAENYKKINVQLGIEDEKVRKKNKMKKYNNLEKDLLALKSGDYIIVTQIKDKPSLQMQQIIHFLQSYVEIYKKHQKIQQQSQLQELKFPDFQYNEQNNLSHIVVDIVCEQPGQFYNLETKQNNEKLQKILQNFVFSPDNAFKMVLIAFRIQAKLPVIIMGETGIGKTYCIKILSQLMEYEFRVIEIDSGMHVDKIVNAILDYQNDKKWDIQKVIIFLDEVNTAKCVNGIIKEIVIDRHINGTKIKDNIVFVAACNPYQYKKYEIGIAQYYQQNEIPYKLEYNVQPLRESFSYCIINFKSLSENQEQQYIKNLIILYQKKNKTSQISQIDVDMLKLFIRKESCERSVSLRDVNRFLTLFFYFYKTYFKIRFENKKISNQVDHQKEVKQKSVIIALFLVYYLRLQLQVKREFYIQFYEYLVAENKWSTIKFKQTVDEELQWLTNECGIQSQYIAKNNALQENIFCIVMCLLNKIPLIITGEPGTSKTLSFSIALTCLKGNTSSKFFQSQPTIKEFYYQGNSQTTSKHIQDVFNQARKYQASLKSQFQIIPLVAIDEIGQGENNKTNPNKILHYQLENCDLAFLAISNVELDVSNMNRCLHLYRQRFTEQDLKEFISEIIKGFKNFSKEIKDQIFQIAQIYHKFQQGQKSQKHGTRDFYYTVKYSCHKLNQLLEQNNDISNQDVSKLIAQAFFKNFGGDNQNQEAIMKLVLKTFQLQNNMHEFSQAELIRESIQSINNGDFYHSRFLMLITKDPISCTNYVQSLFSENNKNSEVFMGSHFRDDHTIDLSKDISKLNSRIESSINVISVQQYYLYTIYYDFFTMNFIKMGENNTFRISYKSFSKRVQVKPEFIFVIITHQDEYEHMDPALLNRFEKYIVNLKDFLSESDRKLLIELKREIKQLENAQSNMKLFTFSSESELYSLFIQQRSIKQKSEQMEMNQASLKQQCLNKLGDLTFRTYMFHNKKNKNISQYKDWLNRSYLDNLLNYLQYQKQINQQQIPFKSIIYTTSFTHEKYKNWIDLNGFNSKIINLKIYPTKEQFLLQLDNFYSTGNEDLLILAVEQNYESYKNLCYLQYELQLSHSIYYQKNKNIKNIILMIQLTSLNIKGLAFQESWNQVQIENLLPHVYTVPVNVPNKILSKANQKLNYRYLTNNNRITILTEKSDSDIFQYFLSTPGFFASLMTSIQINDNHSSNDGNQNKYAYLNSRISFFKKLLCQTQEKQSEYQSQFFKFLFSEFERKIRIDYNYDEQWSAKIQFPALLYKNDEQNKKNNKKQQIPIINFEKILIYNLREFVIDQLSQIVVIMEKKNFIIESLIQEGQINEEQGKIQLKMMKEYFQDFLYKESIQKILQKIPQNFKLIYSKQIYKKLEENKLRLNALVFDNIKENKNNLALYIEDFQTLKSLPSYFKEILKMLVNLNQILSFSDIHQFCWDYEDLITQNAELVERLQVENFINHFQQFLNGKYQLDKEKLKTFFREFSFQCIAIESSEKSIKQFEKQVNIFIKFYSIESFDSQILIYLLKLREIIPSSYEEKYKEIKNNILQHKSMGILKLQEDFQILEVPDLDQLKFGINFYMIHLNLSFLSDQERSEYIKNFLNYAYMYLESEQTEFEMNIKIKQGVSLIVEQYIEQNKESLFMKLILDLQPEIQKSQSISSILRQFFDPLQSQLDSKLSLIFIEAFYNELSVNHKDVLLSTLNFMMVYRSFLDSNKVASFNQFIAISCLKLLTQYLVDPLLSAMKTGILDIKIQNNTFIDLLIFISQNFQIDKPQNNPIQNYMIQQLMTSVTLPIAEYANQLEKNKWNQNQMSFIYSFVINYEEYNKQLQNLLINKDCCAIVFKINKIKLNPPYQFKTLCILKENNTNLCKIQYLYPILNLLKVLHQKFAYKFNQNDLDDKQLSFIFDQSSDINENLLKLGKHALEQVGFLFQIFLFIKRQILKIKYYFSLKKILDLDEVTQLKLSELLCSNKNQSNSRIFNTINRIISIQNTIIEQFSGHKEKKICEATQYDFIEIKSELFNQKHLYIFSDESGAINYHGLDNFYKKQFLNFKPMINTLNQFDFQFKKQFYELDLLYHGLKVKQELLNKDQIQLLENQNIDTESCVEARNVLIKLNQILKIKENKKGDSEVLITKLIQASNKREEINDKIFDEKEEIDDKIIQILDTIACKYLCSTIQYFENKIMDCLISQLLPKNFNFELIKQQNSLNLLIKYLEERNIQLEFFKILIGRFILRLHKNFQVESLENNLFHNIYDQKYQSEFFSQNELQSILCLAQDLKSYYFSNEDSLIIYYKLVFQIEDKIKKQEQEQDLMKQELQKNKRNQNKINLVFNKNNQEINQNFDQIQNDTSSQSQSSNNFEQDII